MPHSTHKKQCIESSFLGINALIQKIQKDGDQTVLTAIKTFKMMKQDARLRHKELSQQRAEKTRELKKLTEELEANDRELADLKAKIEEDCQEFKYALSMADRLQASLCGNKFDCTICLEKFHLSGIVACPNNHQVCLACFDRLENTQYGPTILKKKNCPMCRHLFTTVELEYPDWRETDPFPQDSPPVHHDHDLDDVNPSSEDGGFVSFSNGSRAPAGIDLLNTATEDQAAPQSPQYSPHDFEPILIS